MVIGPDSAYSAKPEQYDEIDALLEAAFNRPEPAALVRQLRRDGDIWEELVKPWEGVIAGYLALSRMKAPRGWACLGPIAVLPRMQRGAADPNGSARWHYAVGKRMIDLVASTVEIAPNFRERSRELPTTVVVTGIPEFFQLSRFSLARARNLVTPFSVDCTLIARPGDDVPDETLVYPPAFDGFDMEAIFK